MGPTDVGVGETGAEAGLSGTAGATDAGLADAAATGVTGVAVFAVTTGFDAPATAVAPGPVDGRLSVAGGLVLVPPFNAIAISRFRAICGFSPPAAVDAT